MQQQLILDHLPMVQTVARRLARRYPECVDLGDLVGIGAIGLIGAAERFEGSVADSFKGYARIRVQGAIVDALRQQDWVPRTVRSKARDLDRARRDSHARLGREPTPDELARRLHVTPAQLDHLKKEAEIYAVVSTEESRGDQDDHRVGDSLVAADECPAEHASRNSVRARICEAITTLDQRDQEIIRRYYYDNESLKDIGLALGVTESRVSQLHTRIKKLLREALSSDVENGII